MEPLVVWLLIFVVFFCVLYFTVKAAVRDGILRPAGPAGGTAPARRAQREKGWLNAILFSFIQGVPPHPRRRRNRAAKLAFCPQADGTLRALGVF